MIRCALEPSQLDEEAEDSAEADEVAAHFEQARRPADLETRRVFEALRNEMFGVTPEPTRIGRYEVQEVIGAGGIGIVYAAHDPQLDRTVALKLLRGPAAEDDRDLARLEREAQALARLSHPNVINVYEVGRHEGSPFIAMEYAHGLPLDQWLRDDHAKREILAVFLAAGRGLAAAHASGLVHRDFKPSNVLVADDGRVRVLDFGLAREPGAVGGPSAAAERKESPSPSSSLTDPGSFVGTPAYSAPEQRRGETVDARADVYSYCVALWEAMFGHRPDTESGRRHPRSLRWLARILKDGLAPDPQQRPSDLGALIDRIEGALRARRIWKWGAVGTAVALGLVAVSRLPAAAPAPPACATSSLEHELDGIWDDGVRESLAEVFGAKVVPYAPDTWRKLEPLLDEYAARWIEARERTCLALLEDATPHELDAQTCLTRRLRELATLTRIYAEPDPAVVEHVLEAAIGLSPISSCIRPDPRSRDSASEPVALLLAEARAMRGAGRSTDATRRAETAERRALELADEAGAVQASVLLGRLASSRGDFVTAEQKLLSALERAEAGGLDALALEATLGLIRVLSLTPSRSKEAQRWTQLARGKIAASAPSQREDLVLLEANIAFGAGRFEDARGGYREILATLSPDDPALVLRRAEISSNLGISQTALGQYAEAEKSLEDALDVFENTLGAEHPDVARGHGFLAELYSHQGLATLTHQHAAEAHRRYTALFEESNIERMIAQLNYAASMASLGRREEALVGAEALVAVAHELPEHPLLGLAHLNAADVLRQLGRLDEALEHGEAALEALVHVYGDEHAVVATARVGLGRTHTARGEYELARSRIEAGLGMLARAEGPDHPDTLLATRAKARLELQIGDVGKARSLISGSIDRLRSPDQAIERARCRFVLAQVLARETDGLDAAHREARAALEALPDPEAREAIEIREWLAAFPRVVGGGDYRHSGVSAVGNQRAFERSPARPHDRAALGRR